MVIFYERKKCNRIKFLIELLKDWDELNLAFKSLLFIGGLMFLIIALLTVFGNEGNISQDSIESMFRTTVSSVFGFLLSSNIKMTIKKYRLYKKFKIQILKKSKFIKK